MLTIRYSRVGKKRKPFFRVIIQEKSKSPKSNVLEILGHYDPRTKEVVLKTDRIEYWLSKGAQTSSTVHNLLMKEGIIKSKDKARSVFISKKRKAKIEDKKNEGKPAEAATSTDGNEKSAEASAEAGTEEQKEEKSEDKSSEEKSETKE